MQRLINASRKTVGTKQTQKFIESGQVLVVYIAKDAEERVTSPLLQMCKEKGIEVVYVDSMKELGNACGIKVGAATAAVLK